MNESDEKTYQHIWTTNLDDYVVLLGDGAACESGLIYNVRNQTVFALDDERLNDEIIKHLVGAGAPVVRRIEEIERR